jgi:dUTP pyrophosphatase
MSALRIGVTRLPHAADLPLPAYATPGSAGLDIVAAVPAPVELAPGERCAIPTGLAFALPEGFEAQLRPRSGLALRQGLTLLNSPGTVDADYRGEVQVILINLGRETVTIRRGDRIAQLIIAPVARIAWEEFALLPPSARGSGGFGSTGS